MMSFTINELTKSPAIAAEWYLLSCAVFWDTTPPPVPPNPVPDLLKLDHFTTDDTRFICKRMLEWHKRGQKIDSVLFPNSLERDEPGISYRISLAYHQLATPWMYLEWARVVTDNAVGRVMDEAKRAAEESVRMGDPIDLQRWKAKAEELQTVTVKERSNIDAMRDWIESAEERMVGNGHPKTPTGLRSFDAMVGGIRPSMLWIVSARPGDGKTTFATSLCSKLLLDGVPCAFVSSEMSHAVLMGKMATAAAEVAEGEFTERNLQKITAAAGKLAKAPFYCIDNIVNFAKVTDWVTDVVTKNAVRVVFIDHINRFSVPGFERRREEVSAVARGCKNLAVELGIHVIAPAQASRAMKQEKRSGTLEDLSESDVIGQESDVAMVIEPEGKAAKRHHQPINLRIVKNRHGETGPIFMMFRKDIGRFYEIQPDLGQIP